MFCFCQPTLHFYTSLLLVLLHMRGNYGRIGSVLRVLYAVLHISNRKMFSSFKPEIEYFTTVEKLHTMHHSYSFTVEHGLNGLVP